jgi:hypothetical protein
VIENEDRLREAFETHEDLAPDPAAVYARVQELSRTYHRRRRGLQAAGGAVLGAGLIAGAVNLPAMLSALAGDNSGVTVGVAAAGPSPSVSPTLSQAELEKDWAAYFAAGYGYNDAVKLARIWHLNGNDIGSVKAEAGRRLLAGETLPITPGPEDTTGPSADPKEAAEVQKFFAAGYTYNDAVKLARLWKLSDPYQAKVAGGKKLLAGETLPILP